MIFATIVVFVMWISISLAQIKLVDFGSAVISNPAESRPYFTKFYGTTAYASPEILNKEPYQVASAEVWALGVLLSYLLTGAAPFASESDKKEGKITLDKSGARLSRECLQMLAACLEADPARRASIGEVSAHPWLYGAYARDRVLSVVQ